MLIKFYIGLGAKEGLDRRDALDAFGYRLTRVFGGCTRYLAVGDWTDQEGRVCSEDSAVYEVYTSRKPVHIAFGLHEDLVKLVAEAKVLFGQRTVLVTWHDAYHEFI